jgi:DNA-binding SARP family transcriptional activator/Flp pilus assembly protein TadD
VDTSSRPIFRAGAVSQPTLELVDRTRQGKPQKLVGIQLFGAMHAITHSGRDVLPRSRRARAILGYLCLVGARPVPRLKLASLLWDRVTEAQSRASLRQVLSELTSAWGPIGNTLEATRETLRLDVDKCWVDVLALFDLSQDHAQPTADDFGTLSGRFLDDLDGLSSSFDEWLAAERSRIERRFRELHEKRLIRLVSDNAVPTVRVRAARDFLEFDPTNESGWRALMKALVDMGDRAQAIKEYQRCCEILRRLVDVEPSRETKGLHAALKFESPRASITIADAITAPSAQQRSRIRVGVLPFGGTGPAEDPSLPWSISLDTAAALARFRWFDVIAPMALSGLEPQSLNWQEKLGEFRLDYLIQGTLKTVNGVIRVRVVLLKVNELTQSIWSDSYDLPVNEAHKADEQIALKLVARVDPVILFSEGTRPSKDNWPNAVGLVLKAIPLMYSMESKKYQEAGSLLARAAQEWPNDSMAAAWHAFWYMFNVTHGWSKAPVEEYAEAERLCRKAIELDPENAVALGIYAHLCSYVHHDFDAAFDYFERSLNLNPSLAFVWALSAPTSCYVGDPQDALARLQRYRDLAPLDPYFRIFETMYVMAYTFAGDYERAVTIGRRIVRANPNFTNVYKPLIAALGHLGHVHEAGVHLQGLIRLESDFSIRTFVQKYPFRREDDRSRYVMGLRKAGVPEE